MKKLIVLCSALLLLGACQKKEEFQYTVDKFYDLEILRYDVPGFDQLSLQQKTLIYYLSEAALQGRDILYDQNGRYNLRIRRACEALYPKVMSLSMAMLAIRRSILSSFSPFFSSCALIRPYVLYDFPKTTHLNSRSTHSICLCIKSLSRLNGPTYNSARIISATKQLSGPTSIILS